LIKALGLLVLLSIFFVAGYFTASWQFVYSDTYLANEAIRITSGNDSGVLPAGTELHYQSMAHGEVDFYAFIRIPHKEAMEKTQKVEVDTYNGVKRLQYSAK